MIGSTGRLPICLDNNGYEVSLERRKIYVALPEESAENGGQLRIIDESGEDHLYPVERFVVADRPQSTRRRLLEST